MNYNDTTLTLEQLDEIIMRLPPSLREALKYMDETGEYHLTAKELIKRLQISEKHFYKAVHDLKKQGIDFYRIWTDFAKRRLFNEHAPAIYQKLIEKCLAGNLRAIELFMRAVGDLRDFWKVEHTGNININIMFIKALEEARQRLKEIQLQKNENE